MLASSIVVLAAGLAAAQTPAKGYVVRVDSGTVWLDLTAADGAAPGRGFLVYTEGAELKHPVTGQSLGRVEDEVASGEIAEVAAQFSTGRLRAQKSDVKVGQRARLAAPAATATTTQAPLAADKRAPTSRGAALGYSVVAMAVGDFDGIGKPEVALASDTRVSLYAYPAAENKALAEAEMTGTGVRIVGLDAADMDGDGRAELFVSIYDPIFKRFETRVFKLESGKWLKVASLPFLTHGYQDETGARRLATQQVVDDYNMPFGRVHPLVYKDGRYEQGPTLPLRRADWLYGFTSARLAGQDATLSITNVHALRVQFDKGQWRTPDDDYGQTPVRVRWGDKLLEFNPPLAATYGADGLESLYALRNMAALGGLASPFGLFNHGELVRKRWNGLGFDDVWRADLPGASQGLAVAEPAPGRREILVAVRGSADQSSIWVFDP